MIKLIDAVREARKRGCNYIAVDNDGEMFGYDNKPYYKDGVWQDNTRIEFLGDYILTCCAEKTLINVNDIETGVVEFP